MRKTLVALSIGLLLLGILAWRLVHPSGEIGTDLLLGWIAFLARVVPALDVRWDGVAVLAGGLATLTLVGHYFLRWLYGEMATDGAQPRREWRLRWTLALVGFVILMFAAGISIIGATHQIAWLCRSDEPLFGQDLPYVYRYRSTQNLKEIGLGIWNHSDVYRSLPTQWSKVPDQPRQSWVTQILPFINYSTDTIDPRREWNDPVNAGSFRAILPVLCNSEFRNPPLRDRHGFGLNHYAGNSQIFDRQEQFPLDGARDGTANTLMVGEVNGRFVPWGQPQNSRDPAQGLGTAEGFSGVPGSHGANFVMLDGSVRFVEEGIDPKVLEAMSTPTGTRE